MSLCTNNTDDPFACGFADGYGQCVEGVCVCTPYTALTPNCSYHITELAGPSWAAFSTANVIMFGVLWILILLNVIHIHTTRSTQNRHIIWLPFIWTALRVVWPLIPVRGFIQQFFYLWFDLLGADFGLAYACFSAIELALIAYRHRKEKNAQKQSVKSGRRAMIIAAALVISVIFIFEIVGVFVSMFLGIDMMTPYIIVDIIIITFFVLTILISSSIIIHQLRVFEKITKSSQRRKKLAAFGLTLSIPAALYIIIGIAVAVTGIDKINPDMYVMYFAITRFMELISATSILVKRGELAFYPLMCVCTTRSLSPDIQHSTTHDTDDIHSDVATARSSSTDQRKNVLKTLNRNDVDSPKNDNVRMTASNDSDDMKKETNDDDGDKEEGKDDANEKDSTNNSSAPSSDDD